MVRAIFGFSFSLVFFQFGLGVERTLGKVTICDPLPACLGNNLDCRENLGNSPWNDVAELISTGLNA